MSKDQDAADPKLLEKLVLSLQKDLDEVKNEIERLEKKVQEGSPENLKELAARAQADLQNAKDRLEKQGMEMRQFALEGFLRKLLPTIDNLQRAFQHLPDDLKAHDWVKGVLTVEQNLMNELSQVGLTKIDCSGQVDPEKHEVLQTGPGEQGKILNVFEGGYEFHGKVLRPAKVRVGNGE